MARRVVITGLGLVSPLGLDVETTWRALCEGRSGVGFITDFDSARLRSDVCASVKGFDPTAYLSAKETEIYGRVTQLSLAAATEAMRHAGLGHLRPMPPEGEGAGDDASDGEPEGEASHARADASRAGAPAAGAPAATASSARAGGAAIDPTRIGCLMSTGQGSVDIFEQQIERSRERGPRAVSPYFIPGVMPNSGTALIAMRYGLMGPSYNLASACATGTHSIATSALMIEAGEADVMLAGGAEAATRLNTVAGFGNARALARAIDGDPTRASRPFDKKRTGFVMGEGAGALVLESEEHARARGARPLAYLAGFGMSTDALHLTRPHPDGLGLRLAVERALARAGIGPSDIGYINPHATSTTQGDVAEILALRRVFGEHLSKIPISATKSMVGHLLGGAGGMETIAVVCSLRDGSLHPSINVDEVDPAFADLRIVRERSATDARYAMKISAGFGGHNCVLVLERAS